MKRNLDPFVAGSIDQDQVISYTTVETKCYNIDFGCILCVCMYVCVCVCVCGVGKVLVHWLGVRGDRDRVILVVRECIWNALVVLLVLITFHGTISLGYPPPNVVYHA